MQRSETRARHAFIDASLENTLDQLQKPEVIEWVGVSAAGLYQSIIEKLLYIPNIRHGVLKLPKTINDNMVPVLALQPDEAVKVDPRIRLQTPIQTTESLKRLKQWLPTEEAVKFATSLGISGHVPESPFTIKSASSADGFVISALRHVCINSPKIGKNEERYFLGRPVMALTYSPEIPRMMPDVVAHEIMHVDQDIFSPVQRYDIPEGVQTSRLRAELAAYDLQAYFIEGLAVTGYEPLPGEGLNYSVSPDGRAKSIAGRINNMRRETNAERKDKFFPNGTLQKALGEIGLDVIYTNNVLG